MDLENEIILENVITECEDLIKKSIFKLNILYLSKYPDARDVLYTHDENPDFFQMVEQIADDYDIEESEVYCDVLECKYPPDGRFFKHTVELLATCMARYEIMRNKIND